jgi:4-amino-4-deoxy-L-arabinose transferase-like glycosyltransferase
MQKKTILILIILVSVALRIGASFYLGQTVVQLPGTADQVSYHTLAIRLLNGYGFSFGQNWWPVTPAGEPTAHWSFIYTFYLAGVYAITGQSVLAARILQAVIVGILQPLLAYFLGERIFGRIAGLIAAAWMALYGYFIYYSATLMTEPFYITTILAILVIAIRLGDASTRETARSRIILLGAGLGLTLGMAILLRQLFIILLPFIGLWIAYNFRIHRKKIPVGSLLVSLGMIILMIVPFTIYNYSRFGHLVPLNTNAGYAFFLSNHPIHGTHFIAARDLYSYQDLYPPELLHLDEAALDQSLLVRGLQFVVDDPRRYFLLSLSRIPIYFNFWPLPGSDLISNITKVLSFGLMLPFSLIGIIAWIRKFSLSRISLLLEDPGTLLLGVGMVYSLIHILSWVQVRYRLPVDAILIPFAAAGLWLIIERVQIRFPKETAKAGV